MGKKIPVSILQLAETDKMTSHAMSFFQNLANEDPSPEVAEDSPRTKLQKQLSALSFGSGILDTEDFGNFPPMKDNKPSLGTPPKANTCILPGAFFSGSGTLDMSAPPQKEVLSPVGSPLAAAGRSRNGSTASQRYVPPKGKYSNEQPRDSDQQRFKQWLSWDNGELEKRKRALIGKTVVGKLSPQHGNRYFVKWNINANDTIVISADKVEEVLGETAPAGMWVSCTIVGLGPGHVQWNKQHPYARTLESRETRASHQPQKGKMARGSSHWKKSQKAGLSTPIVNAVSSRQTVPAEIDMARYVAGRGGLAPRPQVPILPETLPTREPLRPPMSNWKGLREHVMGGLSRHSSRQSSPPLADSVLDSVLPSPKESLGQRINGANINLVTGEIRRRGRAESAGSWR